MRIRIDFYLDVIDITMIFLTIRILNKAKLRDKEVGILDNELNDVEDTD